MYVLHIVRKDFLIIIIIIIIMVRSSGEALFFSETIDRSGWTDHRDIVKIVLKYNEQTSKQTNKNRK